MTPTIRAGRISQVSIKRMRNVHSTERLGSAITRSKMRGSTVDACSWIIWRHVLKISMISLQDVALKFKVFNSAQELLVSEKLTQQTSMTWASITMKIEAILKTCILFGLRSMSLKLTGVEDTVWQEKCVKVLTTVMAAPAWTIHATPITSDHTTYSFSLMLSIIFLLIPFRDKEHFGVLNLLAQNYL